MRRWSPLVLLVSLACAVTAPPAPASAATHTFGNSQQLFTPGEPDLVGPANQFPSTISVAGLAGTVTKATVTLINFNAFVEDIDMVIVGPNGQKVMLMSDACSSAVLNRNWTFDDDAPTFLSDSPTCPSAQQASFMPSNYLGNDVEDDLSAPPGGAANGPAPDYVNRLSFLAGGSPNGAWNLFVIDDEEGVLGLSQLSGWSLALEVDPPPPAQGNPPAPTGKKCKKKKGKKAGAAAKKCKKKKKK